MDFSYLKKKKVLVVDDFANVRRSVKSQLIDLGIDQVWEAAGPDQATKAVHETRFDLILCDYNLGKGRDGSRLLEEWRTQKVIRPDTIFVLITAETSRDVVISALEFQPDDYLAKPFTMEVLANRLHRWFSRRQALLPMLVSLEKHDWPAVAQTSKDIMESQPKYRAIVQKTYVEALIQMNQVTEAENFLLGLLDKRYQSWAQTQLHRLDLLQKKYEAAETGLIEVITRDPNMIDAYDLLTEALAAQDKGTEEQEWLERGVSRSPRNISRQKRLITITQTNQDFRRANTALRDVMNMSAGTMHDDIGNYLSYMRHLQLESESIDNEQRKREIAKEIASVNRKVHERYPSDINAHLFSLAMGIHKSSQPQAEKHDTSLNKLFTETFESIEQVVPETALAVAEAFYMATRINDADSMVVSFKKQFHDQPDVIRRLDELQAEPVSMVSRAEAKKLNLQGIGLYKNKEYRESLPYFSKAMELSPRHPGIILNFVQSHLLHMKAEGVDKKEVALCLETIQRLDYLPKDHYQYERYQKLKANLESIA